MCWFYFMRSRGSGRYWIKTLAGFYSTCKHVKRLDQRQRRSLFIHSKTKALSASEFHCPRTVALATKALFPSDTKPKLKKTLLFRLKAPRVEGKTAITGRWGEKLNTGKLLPRVSGGHGKMILSFLCLLKYLSLALGTIGSCVLVPFLLYPFLYF